MGGNLLRARANVPCVLITEPRVGVFGQNQCHHESGNSPIVQIEALSLAFSSNQVRANQKNVSVSLRLVESGFLTIDGQQVGSPALTVLGNLTNGPIEVDGSPLTDPWLPLNIRLS